MAHDEETIAEMLPEPDDGSILVVRHHGDEYKVILRADDGADRQHPEDRWFNCGTPEDDPMSLYEHVKNANEVFELGATVALFGKRVRT